MKIKTAKVSYEYAMGVKKPKHYRPKKPNIFFRTLIRILSIPDIRSARFSFTEEGMEKIGDRPCLILMNHSSFIDLKIAYRILYPKPFAVVCTSDGLVGKGWLMKQIGCIPTQKFVSDPRLVKDIFRTLKDDKLSVLMYPEASYSFDGRATPLPRHLGKLIKKLNVPVVTIMTSGAFLREPLYNELKKRKKVNVTAEVKCLLTPEELKEMTETQIIELLDGMFSFDHFKTQWDEKIEIDEPYIADGLERILYKCPRCGHEDGMRGEGRQLHCGICKKSYTMDKFGRLTADFGETEFPHIPDWYSFERDCVKKEISRGKYNLDIDVNIGVLRDYKAIYMVGSGTLRHTVDGFVLDGCGGKLHYTQPPSASYSLYSDYYWYEIDDVICIGDNDTLYYCFPKIKTPVAKVRLATEEIYKLTKEQRSDRHSLT